MTAAAARYDDDWARPAAAQVEVDPSTPARRRHLGAALNHVTEDVAHRRLVDAILAPLDDAHADADLLPRYGGVLEVLGIAEPATARRHGGGAVPAIREVLRPALWRLNLPALVLVLDVVRHRYAEARLSDASVAADGRSDAVHDWLMVLWEEYGYEPSDFETSRAADESIATEEAVQDPGEEPGPNAMVMTFDPRHQGRREVF